MWCVYFLGFRNSDIYVGSTNDLRRRLESHHFQCLKYSTSARNFGTAFRRLG
ncbi:hypothetical protein EB232_05845 [Mesorhizobium sp. NZP2077]|nr:hypothetical protein EB232_05845 [Mesorhizobium sp. NZP2077]QKD14658.1 GIY-YIG nuclease family protein [Mesorhizobium sp. NZP2077]